MATIKAEEVRIPHRAREAVSHHEEVVAFNRERPADVIVHPDDHASTARSLRYAHVLLAQTNLSGGIGVRSSAWGDLRTIEDELDAGRRRLNHRARVEALRRALVEGR